jgi:hypothetical protein
LGRLPAPVAAPSLRLLVAPSMAFALAAALALMAMRVGSVFTFGHFPLVYTSGGEADAALGIWRAAHGNAYPDPMKVPFTASYYNWLFYTWYAGIWKVTDGLLALGVDAFSTIGRLVTLSAVAFACLLSWRVMRLVVRREEGLPTIGYVLLYYALLGPLTGWWAVSLHPEIWATTLSIAAVLGFIYLYDPAPLRAVMVASVASVAAWSFKQSYLFVALAMGLFLAERRDWRGLCLAVSIHLLGIAIALRLGSATYRFSLILAGTDGFAPAQLVHNLLGLIAKAGAVLLMAGLVLSDRTALRALWQDTPGRFALLVAASCLAVVPMTGKHGAADYYYLPLIVFSSFVGARIDEAWRRCPPSGLLAGVVSLTWACHGVLCTVVLLGLAGLPSVAADDPKYQAQRRCVRALPSPMWAADEKLSLPWVHPEGPHFVEFFDYATYRRRGLEAGGVGGMVKSGTFASLVVPHNQPVTTIDGTSIPSSYFLARDNCAGLDIYRRAGPVP